MKRFLILFTLVVFSVVSCAWPNKTKIWTRPGGDFRQDEFEQDRAGCIESIDQSLHSEAFGRALEECLAWKGYEYGAWKRWERPHFKKAQFQQDTEECEQAIRKDLEHPKTLSECLTEKGYSFKSSSADKDKKKPMTAGKLLLLLGLFVLAGPLAAILTENDVK